MANQIVKGLKKYVPVFKEAKDEDRNEADIVTRIVKFLEDVLGYDALKHITKEFQVKERFVDLAIKIDNKVKFYIEVKSSNVNLKESQIFQAESYAAQSGVEWVVLTNGSDWHMYHLVFDKTGIEHLLVLDVDLLNDDPYDIAEDMYYLTCDAMRRNEITDYLDKHLTLHADSVIKALFHEDTLTAIKRELGRKSGIRVSEDEVLESVKKLLSDDVISKYGESIRIRRKRKTSKSKDISADGQSGETVVQPSTIEAPKVEVQKITGTATNSNSLNAAKDEQSNQR